MLVQQQFLGFASLRLVLLSCASTGHNKQEKQVALAKVHKLVRHGECYTIARDFSAVPCGTWGNVTQTSGPTGQQRLPGLVPLHCELRWRPAEPRAHGEAERPGRRQTVRRCAAGDLWMSLGSCSHRPRQPVVALGSCGFMLDPVRLILFLWVFFRFFT